MSRSKEAVVVLLNAGFTMRNKLRERSSLIDPINDGNENTRFDAAVAAIDHLIQQKMFYKPKDEVGIVCYGTKETQNQLNDEQGEDEYTNVQVISHLDTPTLELARNLQQLVPTNTSDVNIDILDGLIVALDLLYRRTDGKNYQKKHLMVITDAEAKINDAGDIEAIVQMIHSMEIELQIIGIDFTITTEMDALELVKIEEKMENELSVKLENERMLLAIAKEVKGSIVSVSRRMQLFSEGMKKAVAQTTKFRGYLTIGLETDDTIKPLEIPVYCYLKTKVATLPTLKKESQISRDEQKNVRMDRRYTAPDNPDEEVPPDEQVKAYRYGHEKVPFSSADVEFFKFHTEKSLLVLGFVNRNQIHAADFISGTDIFVAEPGKPYAATALAALVQGMVEKNTVAIARFVARKNAAPKIIALIPHQSSANEPYVCLWGQQLPYEEDRRMCEFAPLNSHIKSEEDANIQCATALVDALSVKKERSDEIGVGILNPVLRRFCHSVVKRAMEGKKEDSLLESSLPKHETFVVSKLTIDAKRLQQKPVQDALDKFAQTFQLKEAAKKRNELKKKSFWSDPKANSLHIKTEGNNEEPEDDNDDDGELDLDDLLESTDNKVQSVGSMNPIADFESLLLAKRPHVAVNGLETQILAFFDMKDHQKMYFCKALQCLEHLRARSIEISYSNAYNSFLWRLKTALNGASYDATNDPDQLHPWGYLIRDNLTLLSTQEDSSILNVTSKDQRTFLHGDDEIETNPMEIVDTNAMDIQQDNMIEEDDPFAEFE